MARGKQRAQAPIKTILATLGVSFTLASCNYLPDWMGQEEAPKLKGERIALTAARSALTADAELEDAKIIVPQMPVNAAWPQALGNATGVSGNLSLGDSLSVAQKTTVGQGHAFSSPLVPPPVIANNTLFAMDGAGVISAHALDALGSPRWRSEVLEVNDEENRLVGGGIAWGNNVLYAAGSEGKLVALSATDGKMLWQKELLLPLRTAPRLTKTLILLLAADNQLLVLNRIDGSLLWSHRGISEIAMPLHNALPAARDNVILVSYSSGELVALDQESGTVLWSDTIAGGGDDLLEQSHVSPIMARGLSFGAGPERIVAYETASGRRVWERAVPVKRAPWLAGNTLFLLTPDAQLVAMRGTDGGIHWVKDLPQRDGKEKTLWYGPVVAGSKLWIVSSDGELRSFTLQSGEAQDVISVPANVMTAPVVAKERLYLLTRHADLVEVK